MAYVIGVDFGTASARALLVEVETGRECAVAVSPYPHGVLDKTLPDGTVLPPDWALQHPQDYLDALRKSVRAVVATAGVDLSAIIGLGIDFTASTILPLDARGEPLCLDSAFAGRPHSWPKLWKHHAAQKQADQMTQLAKETAAPFLGRYGGKISSEWMLPKILQVVHEDRELFEEADLFLEAGDWLVYKLTGNLVRSSNAAGYKGMWHKREGYPSKEFMAAIEPALARLYETKLRGEVRPIGSKAGTLTVESADDIGLQPGIAVAVNVIDAHAAVPAVGAVYPGQLVLAMGTSTCHMLIAEEERLVEGVCGTVEDGIIPGYISYETGQVAVGDSFAWFVEQATPAYVTAEATQLGMSVHQWLERKAALQQPGDHGLVALDWWNGNRSMLVDSRLSGMIIGLTLATKPEDLYRALLESTAFGTRKIIEAFSQENIPVKQLFACGGLPQKNKLLMQIYADVLNREIFIADSDEITAFGAAMYAATAAGKEGGGYDSIFEASRKMAKVKAQPFVPNPENVARYEKLYRIYTEIHDVFGRDGKQWMHALKESSCR